MFRSTAWIVPLILVATAVPPGVAAETAKNLALGKPYTLWPAPNYPHCTDPGDATQLTDGQSTRAYFWTEKGTVGWSAVGCAVITVDLGQVEPIGGASFTTAAGTSGVTWPSEVRILVSDDGKSYRDVGDLVVLDQKQNGPWPKGYAIRRLVAQELATRGRFVQFLAVPQVGASYLFVDEVEVLRGPDNLLARDPGGEAVVDAKTAFETGRLRRAVGRRLRDDAAGLHEAIERTASLDAATKARLSEQLSKLQKTDDAPVSLDANFRAVLPLNERHARLFQLQADLWKAAGLPAFSARAAVTWDPLKLIGLPDRSEAALQVHTMHGEYRAAAVNLANAGDRVLEARVRVEGLPGGPMPGWLTLHEVPWTDTSQSEPVGAALPEARRRDGAWSVTVRPGLLQQLWLTFHVTDQPAGQYSGNLLVEVDGLPAERIPITLRIWPLEFPRQTTLYLGGWSYTNGRSCYGVTPENKPALLRHLQSHLVNAPWATSGAMMRFAFDPNDPSKLQIDTGEFDDWIAQWPQARRYCVFLSIERDGQQGQPSCVGAPLGSPEFNERVGRWIHAWVEHLATKGIRPEQLQLLLHDEPNEESHLEAFFAWARAIRAAEPKVRLWEDPTYRDPAQAPAELYTASDVLCPHRPMWLEHAAQFATVYGNQQKEGRTLEFYSCMGPARLLDPYSYYRLQAWHAWQVGGTASYFWAFGDNSGVSSWCEYLAAVGPFTPLFLDAHSVTAAKQMEAIRESVEDYEYFVLLRAAVARAQAAGRSGPELTAAETLLSTAVEEVLGAPGADQVHWREPKDRTQADAVRVRILEALTALK